MSNNYSKTWPQISQVCITHRGLEAHQQRQEPVVHLRDKILSNNSHQLLKKVNVLSLEQNHHNKIIYLLNTNKGQVFKAKAPPEDKEANVAVSVVEHFCQNGNSKADFLKRHVLYVGKSEFCA